MLNNRIAVSALLSVVPLAAHAGELCVACNGPSATYRCAADPPGSEAAISDPRLQLACITEMARIGAHVSCSVEREAAGVCNGPKLYVKLPSAPPLAPQPSGSPTATVEPAPPPQAASPPKTVEELARQTAQSSQEGLKQAQDAAIGTAKGAGGALEKAGSAVGSAVKKSWNCLTSLFQAC